MKATWEDSNSSSSDEEDEGEIANMCFMALEDDEVYLSDLEDSKPSYDELENAFDELYITFEKLKLKYNVLKKKHSLATSDLDSLNDEQGNLKLENEELKLKVSTLEIENKAFKDKVTRQNTILEKFTQGSKALENILNHQRCVFDKSGLGYKPHKNEKYFKNFFVKAKSSNESLHTCTFATRMDI